MGLARNMLLHNEVSKPKLSVTSTVQSGNVTVVMSVRWLCTALRVDDSI
jgi:hypothetical protein